MSVEKLINNIKLRPQMYVYPVRLDYIYHYINGFLYSNEKSSTQDDLDTHNEQIQKLHKIIR